MALVSINAITSHLNGMVGDLVFKPYLGRLVAALRPKPTTKEPTAAQIERQLAFRKAINYARSVLMDPARRPAYEAAAQAKNAPLMALAVGDYFNAPTVDSIALAEFRGQIGDKIVILASDDVEVMSVQVIMRSSTGTVLESGAAARVLNEWHYTATTLLPLNEQVTIEVNATDRPGNLGQQIAQYTRNA